MSWQAVSITVEFSLHLFKTGVCGVFDHPQPSFLRTSLDNEPTFFLSFFQKDITKSKEDKFSAAERLSLTLFLCVSLRFVRRRSYFSGRAWGRT